MRMRWEGSEKRHFILSTILDFTPIQRELLVELDWKIIFSFGWMHQKMFVLSESLHETRYFLRMSKETAQTIYMLIFLICTKTNVSFTS